MTLIELMENLYKYGLEYYRKYYGPYRALVVDNKDPVRSGRILISCPRARITDKNGIWVLPMMSGAGAAHGVFWPPEIGDAVWLFFDNGDPLRPLGYIGGWYSKDELHSELAPDSKDSPVKKGFVTPGGNKIILDDTSGSEVVTIESKGGQRVQISGTKVKIGSKDGTYEPMMRGKTVKTYLESHTHPTPLGPSGPPIQPFPLDGLSDSGEVS